MKRVLKIIKWLAAILVGFMLIVLISLQAYKIYLENSTEIKTTGAISVLEEITLGGLKQWIFIRGEDKNNPILIFLHGGPGASAPGMPSSRSLDAELIKHVTVVHWDQRGAGKSYDSDIPVSSMTMDRFVEDCNELIDYVRNRFNVQKVFLVAHSSGTVTGIKTAHRYPEKIQAYVGVGQIIHDHEQIRLGYDFIIDEAEKSGDVKIQNAIKTIGPPPYEAPEKLYAMQNYIFRFGGVIHDNSVKRIGGLMLSFFTSPEYSMSDGLNSLMMKGLFFSVSAMWDEINDIDITKEVRSIKVPVYFFEGKYDMATPTVLVKKFYDGLNAVKGKKFIIFEKSAHMPMIEEKEKYENLLINLVLKKNQNN
ncbi:alpha/beta fold hydrolase [Thermodesulfobacteriota bacterium]